MFERTAALLLLLAIALPVSCAGAHLEPGTLVADGGPDQAVLTLLYVQSGFKESQAVYMVRPVARCRDLSGPGWYAPAAVHELRSAPELEGRQRLGTLDPAALPATCANPVPSPSPPARATAWAKFVDGSLDPFGPMTFPPFGSLPATQTTDGGSPDD
ncbi:MAG TPA: hypothetical protein HA263_07445, partial [Methanoregulaceae archaeon]|nr:hypothetical protein [Methanoregulaceae archaeon]